MEIELMKFSHIGMAVVLCAAASVGFGDATGFEASDGFIAPSTVPEGWKLQNGALISSTNVTEGTQSLETPAFSWLRFDSNYALASGEVTQLSVDIFAAAYAAEKIDNYGSYGHLNIYKPGAFAGGMYFYLNDNDDGGRQRLPRSPRIRDPLRQ
jgi:hypothetical protein